MRSSMTSGWSRPTSIRKARSRPRKKPGVASDRHAAARRRCRPAALDRRRRQLRGRRDAAAGAVSPCPLLGQAAGAAPPCRWTGTRALQSDLPGVPPSLGPSHSSRRSPTRPMTPWTCWPRSSGLGSPPAAPSLAGGATRGRLPRSTSGRGSLISASSLAAGLDMAVKNAAGVAGRLPPCRDPPSRSRTAGSGGCSGLAGVAPLRDVVRAPECPDPNRGRGRPRRDQDGDPADKRRAAHAAGATDAGGGSPAARSRAISSTGWR